jgi:hypothetical protein
LPREQFLYTGTDKLCRLIDEAGHRAGVSRGHAFEDFLTCTVCALSAQQMEDEYLAVVAKGYGEAVFLDSLPSDRRNVGTSDPGGISSRPLSMSRTFSSSRCLRDSASLTFVVRNDRLNFLPPKRKLTWKLPDGSGCNHAILHLQ